MTTLATSRGGAQAEDSCAEPGKNEARSHTTPEAGCCERVVPSLIRSAGICTNRFKRQNTVPLGQDGWRRQRNLVEQNRQWREVHTERRCGSRRHLPHSRDPEAAPEATTGVGWRCAGVSQLLAPGQQVSKTVRVIIPPPRWAAQRLARLPQNSLWRGTSAAAGHLKPLRFMHMQTHIHADTLHTHTYILHIHTHTHTHIHTSHKHIHAYTYIPQHIYTQHTHMHTYILHTYMHVSHAHTHMHAHTYIPHIDRHINTPHMHIYTHISHTRIHTYILHTHAYTHTYTYLTYTHTDRKYTQTTHILHRHIHLHI